MEILKAGGSWCTFMSEHPHFIPNLLIHWSSWKFSQMEEMGMSQKCLMPSVHLKFSSISLFGFFFFLICALKAETCQLETVCGFSSSHAKYSLLKYMLNLNMIYMLNLNMIQDEFSSFFIFHEFNLSDTNATCLTTGQDKANKKG